jgi:hypothetical protein
MTTVSSCTFRILESPLHYCLNIAPSFSQSSSFLQPTLFSILERAEWCWAFSSHPHLKAECILVQIHLQSLCGLWLEWLGFARTKHSSNSFSFVCSSPLSIGFQLSIMPNLRSRSPSTSRATEPSNNSASAKHPLLEKKLFCYRTTHCPPTKSSFTESTQPSELLHNSGRAPATTSSPANSLEEYYQFICI